MSGLLIASTGSLRRLGSLLVVAVGAEMPVNQQSRAAAMRPAIPESGSVPAFSVAPALRGRYASAARCFAGGLSVLFDQRIGHRLGMFGGVSVARGGADD